jgi:hypothetical protein
LRRRKRNSFAKIGTVATVLVLALGIMGVAYSSWADMVSITGEVETGVCNTLIAWSQSGSEPPSIGSFDVDTSGMTLDITLENAQDDVNYYGIFYIYNLSSSTLPVKIKSITVTPPIDDPDPMVPDWSTYGFSGNLTFVGETKTPEQVIGYQLDPGENMDGRVNIRLDGAGVGSGLNFIIAVETELWNQ